MKFFQIKQGNHRSGVYCKAYCNRTIIGYTVVFGKGCLYNLNNEDQLDINKLFGLSYGFHHSNSARFGWRCNPRKLDKIELLTYCYVQKQRVPALSLGYFDTETPYYLELIKTHTNYNFFIYNSKDLISNKSIPFNGKMPKWGYQLFPYFGGNQTAPHDMTIEFYNKNLLN